MGSVYRLTLRQLSGKWRLLIMTVLAGMPVVIATVMVISPHAPSVREFETAVLSAMLAGSIAPLVVLAIAAAAFGNGSRIDVGEPDLLPFLAGASRSGNS